MRKIAKALFRFSMLCSGMIIYAMDSSDEVLQGALLLATLNQKSVELKVDQKKRKISESTPLNKKQRIEHSKPIDELPDAEPDFPDAVPPSSSSKKTEMQSNIPDAAPLISHAHTENEKTAMQRHLPYECPPCKEYFWTYQELIYHQHDEHRKTYGPMPTASKDKTNPATQDLQTKLLHCAKPLSVVDRSTNSGKSRGYGNSAACTKAHSRHSKKTDS